MFDYLKSNCSFALKNIGLMKVCLAIVITTYFFMNHLGHTALIANRLEYITKIERIEADLFYAFIMSIILFVSAIPAMKIILINMDKCFLRRDDIRMEKLDVLSEYVVFLNVFSMYAIFALVAVVFLVPYFYMAGFYLCLLFFFYTLMCNFHVYFSESK